MGFIKVFTGALGGTFADQWQDFYIPRQDVPATDALFQGTNNTSVSGNQSTVVNLINNNINKGGK